MPEKVPSPVFLFQVNKLFSLFKYKPSKPKEAYTVAWDLRMLYTFAYRRQNDAQKRGQTPRDRLFEFLWHFVFVS